MAETLLTDSDSKMIGKLIIFLEQGTKIKKVDTRILFFRNLKNFKYYVSLLDFGQLAEGDSIDNVMDCVSSIIYNLNEPDNTHYMLPTTPDYYLQEYSKLSKDGLIKIKHKKLPKKFHVAQSQKPVMVLMKVSSQ